MDEYHLLRSFSNVKNLRIDKGHIIKELSRSLNSEDGELPLVLLPELQELPCFGIGGSCGAFRSSIDARKNTGLPVYLIYDPYLYR